MQARLNFIRQQGFKDAHAASCDAMFPALLWQPRVLLVLVSLGVLFETSWYFIVLGVILWWNAALPHLNPFDAFYNRFRAKKDGFRLAPALAPRRTAQAIAGTLSLAIGIAMRTHRFELAWLLQVLFLIALVLLVFARFCLGSFLFYLVTGQVAYAWRTMPWSRSEAK